MFYLKKKKNKILKPDLTNTLSHSRVIELLDITHRYHFEFEVEKRGKEEIYFLFYFPFES